MKNRPLRILAFVFILILSLLMLLEASEQNLFFWELGGCLVFSLGFAGLTRKKKNPLWIDTGLLLLMSLVLLGLMLLDTRPMLPGILYFLLIPSTLRMPLFQRLTAPFCTVLALICVYLARELYISVDPILPICQFVSIVSISTLTEYVRRQYESMEENQKLLEGLIEAQKQIANTEDQVQSLKDLSDSRKYLAGLLAQAALSLEGSRELGSKDQSRASELNYKAEASLKTALIHLNEISSGKQQKLTLPLRLLVAHANNEVRESLEILAQKDQSVLLKATAGNKAEFLENCTKIDYDLALIDEDIDPEGWKSVLAAARHLNQEAKYVLMSPLPNQNLESEAKAAGALGLVDYGQAPAEIFARLQRLALSPEQKPIADYPGSKKLEFSPREIQILGLIAKGFSNKEISERLFLAEGTIKNRVSSILQKIGARDRGNAALKARELGLI